MTDQPALRTYSRGEIAADAAVHALGVGFALIAGPILIGLVSARGDAWPIVAISVYVATLIAMLSFSASYNLIRIPAARDWLRRLDHSTIYIKIAGAYTPFAMISIAGAVGYGLLAAIWAAAAVGVFLKLVFPQRFEWVSLALYLGMGWAAVAVYGDVAENLQAATLTLVTVAGCLYTFGVIFFLWGRLPFQNAIWHVFVLAATVTLYSAMAVEFV